MEKAGEKQNRARRSVAVSHNLVHFFARFVIVLLEQHYGKNQFRHPGYRDSIHPYTNLKLHETEGPLVITEGDGVFVRDKTASPIWKGSPGSGVSAWDFPSGVWPKPRIARC